MPVKKNRFLLLYGSQTGQAQAIAEEIAEKAEAEDLHADIFCLSHTEKKVNSLLGMVPARLTESKLYISL